MEADPGYPSRPAQTETTDVSAFATTTAARVAIAGALLLGLTAERLLWTGPVGLGLVLWIALFGAAALLVVRQARFPWQRETAIAAALAVAAASITVLRAAPALHALAFAVLITAATIPLLRARSFRFGATPVAVQVLAVAVVVMHAVAGALPLVARDAGRPQLPARVLRPRLVVAVRGALLAVPPLVVFGALFVSADPLFERYTRELTQFVKEDVVARVAFTLAFAWITAGLLRALLPRRSPLAALPAVPTVPAAEVSVALAAVTVLFSAFVLVQARWLFAGADALQAITGLTVADYARRGFFELAAAAALTLPLLLAANSVARATTGAGRRTLRVLSIALVVLVLLIMASALERMALYTARFGLTELRLYTTAFMGWLAIVFAWLAITTLRGRRRRFAAGPVAAGILAVFALVAVNPHALIARVNLERARDGAPLDVRYLTSLSADATPELMRHLDELEPEARCAVTLSLLKRQSQPLRDWRTTNRALQQERTLIRQEVASLKIMTQQCASSS